MYYKELGNTGKKVSAVSFGAMRFLPEDYKDGPQKCADIVLRAQELGVNLFDTAPGYCDDVSEDVLGHAFKQMKNRPYVSTKCGFRQAKTAAEAYVAVQKSIERLHVDKITFYHMWCLRTSADYQKMIAPGGIYEGILRAKQDGLIEHICCSVHLEGEGVKQIVADGLVEAVILGYNALNFAFRRAGVKACHDAGLGVITMNPLGGGLIPRTGDAFSFLKQTPDESVVHAALRFLLGQKEVSCVLPGPSSIAELEECLAAADRAYTFDESFLKAHAEQLKTELNSLCTSCGYCDECPVGIPIVKFLSTYNYYLLDGDLADLSPLIRANWEIAPSVAAKCTRCGLCESLCTQKLPIIQRLAEIGALPQAAK